MTVPPNVEAIAREWRDAVSEPDAGNRGNLPESELDDGRSNRLRPISVAEMRRQVRESGPRAWAVEGILPESTQSAEAGQRKLGKSWLTTDLAVSVATGTPYLGAFRTTIAPVVLYASEFERSSMSVRLEAVCRSKGLNPDADLDFLHVCFTPPQLLRREDVDDVAAFARERDAHLVLGDPFYKSAGGVKLNDLASAGAALNDLTEALASFRCGLRFTHHARKAGGEGLDLFSGVGLVEWARAVSVVRPDGSRRRGLDGFRERDLLVEVEGSDIPDRTLRVTLRLRGSDDATLDSPVDYEVTATDAEDAEPGARLSVGKRRVLAVLSDSAEMSTRQVQEATAHDGYEKPLRLDTCGAYLRDLTDEGLVAGSEGGYGRERKWRRASV